MTPSDVIAVLPATILTLGAGIVVLLERLLPADQRTTRWLAAAIAAAACASALVAGAGDDSFNGALRRDAAAWFITTLIALATAATLVVDASEMRLRAVRPTADVAFTLMAAAGATLLASAGDLLLMFFALELLFMSLLGLVFASRSRATRRASRTLFLAGGTASALFAAGVGLVWSASGAFSIGGLATASSPAALGGAALLLVGLACFAGLVPFQFWLTPALAALAPASALFVSVVPRLAAIAALLRCEAAITASVGAVDWRACLAVIAAATLIAASVAMAAEASVRRLIGYLATAYAGQIAIAVASGAAAGAAVAFALAAFVPLMAGLFAFLTSVPADDPFTQDLRGLARRRPWLVVALAVVAFGIAGLPPTAGFIARLSIFETAVDAQLAWLMFIGAAATVVSAATAARLVFACLDGGPGVALPSRAVSAVAFTAAAVVVLVGLVPGPLLEVTRAIRF